jgi:hypothetical protein
MQRGPARSAPDQTGRSSASCHSFRLGVRLSSAHPVGAFPGSKSLSAKDLSKIQGEKHKTKLQIMNFCDK